MLLQIAIADSYGAGFEFANGNLAKNNLTTYVKHPRHPLLPGQYTDDTQMSIAISELLVEDVDFTPLNIANKFVEVFQRDPREGYAHRFYKFLCSVNSGKEFLQKIKPASEKSGAAMRAGPLGYIKNLDSLLKVCEIQARVTHNTDAGVRSAQAASLLSHYFIYDIGLKEDVGDWICEKVTGPWNEPWTKNKIGVRGEDNAHAAIQAVIQNNSLAELLCYVVNLTGDVDTCAAIAMAGACCSKDYLKDIPENLVLLLESGDYGKDFLISLDHQLLNKFF